MGLGDQFFIAAILTAHVPLGRKRPSKRFHPMSALPPKADIIRHGGNVRFVPLSDICTEHEVRYSITSSASESKLPENVTPSVFATLRLITNSNLSDCITGRSAGFASLRILAA